MSKADSSRDVLAKETTRFAPRIGRTAPDCQCRKIRTPPLSPKLARNIPFIRAQNFAGQPVVAYELLPTARSRQRSTPRPSSPSRCCAAAERSTMECWYAGLPRLTRCAWALTITQRTVHACNHRRRGRLSSLPVRGHPCRSDWSGRRSPRASRPCHSCTRCGRYCIYDFFAYRKTGCVSGILAGDGMFPPSSSCHLGAAASADGLISKGESHPLNVDTKIESKTIFLSPSRPRHPLRCLTTSGAHYTPSFCKRFSKAGC